MSAFGRLNLIMATPSFFFVKHDVVILHFAVLPSLKSFRNAQDHIHPLFHGALRGQRR